MGDAQPINLLIEELKNEDISLRLNAVKRLSTIAIALGPDRTRTELVPFLNDSIDDEDEVLVCMAEELGGLVNFVGGAAHAKCLLPPLETLAAAEETVVRDEAAKAIVSVCEVLPARDIATDAWPMVERLGSADWFTSKISAASVIPATYSKAEDAKVKEALRTAFQKLCEDESPMVRRAASTSLSKFAASLEATHLEPTLLPVFLKLADDEQDSVRLLAVDNCVAIAAIVGKDKAAEHVLPTFVDCAKAKSWRVRYMVADNFVAMCESLEQSLLVSTLLPVFTRLLFKESEPEAEVRGAGAKRVTAMAKLLPKDAVTESLLPAVDGLATDPSQHVRAAIASVIMGLAPVCEKEITMSRLVPLYLSLLNDPIPEVRLNIISHLESLNKVIGVEALAEQLLPAIIELSNDKQWRVRLAILEHIPLLAEHLGVAFFDEQLRSLCFGWLGDCVFTVREAAIQNIKRLSELFGNEWAAANIVPQVVGLKSHTNYLYRITALFATSALAEVVSAETLTNDLLPMVLELAGDQVPNIRFNVCKTLAVIVSVINANSQPAQALIKPRLETLTTDSDIDVKNFAVDALTLFA